MKAHEHFGDRGGKIGLHGEARAAPVAGRTEAPQLVQDVIALLLTPLPHQLHERLAAEVVARLALRAQRLLHRVLRGDAGVIGAGLPERLETAQPTEADHHVLERVVEDVAHVQDAGHVGGRDHDRERGLLRVGSGAEGFGAFPRLVDAGLGGPGVIGLGHVGACHNVSADPRGASRRCQWSRTGSRIRLPVRGSKRLWAQVGRARARSVRQTGRSRGKAMRGA